MRRILANLFIVLFCLSISIPAFAVQEPVSITLSDSGKNVSLDWGIAPKNLKIKLKSSVAKSRLPYWSSPDDFTTEVAGYSGQADGWPSLSYEGFSIEDAFFYFAFDYNEQGYSDDIKNAKLYMVKLKLDEFLISDDDFKELIDSKTKLYGEPTVLTDTSEGIMFSNNGRQTVLTYYYDYIWNGADNTAMRITATYEPTGIGYEDVVIYLGKNDLDSTLKDGKLSERPAPMIAITEEPNIQVRDESGTVIKTLDTGLKVKVLEYLSSTDSFYVEFEISETSTVVSNGISVSTRVNSYDGYISGKGLSVSRDEMIAHFQRES